MKKLLLIALFAASTLVAQDYAVKLWPAGSKQGAPGTPEIVRGIGTNTATPPDFNFVVTKANYDKYAATNTVTQNTFAVNRAKQRGDLAGNVALLRAGLTNWATLTDGQKQGLLKIQLESFLLLGELGAIQLEL